MRHDYQVRVYGINVSAVRVDVVAAHGKVTWDKFSGSRSYEHETISPKNSSVPPCIGQGLPPCTSNPAHAVQQSGGIAAGYHTQLSDSTSNTDHTTTGNNHCGSGNSPWALDNIHTGASQQVRIPGADTLSAKSAPTSSGSTDIQPTSKRDVFALLRHHVKKNRAQLERIFPPDAQLTLSQLKRLVQSLLLSRSDEDPMSGRELRHVMVMLDMDNNNKLSRQEFETGLKDCREVTARAQLLLPLQTSPLAVDLPADRTASEHGADADRPAAQLDLVSLKQQMAAVATRWQQERAAAKKRQQPTALLMDSARLDPSAVKQLLLSSGLELDTTSVRAVLAYLDMWNAHEDGLLTWAMLDAALHCHPCTTELQATAAASKGSHVPKGAVQQGRHLPGSSQQFHGQVPVPHKPAFSGLHPQWFSLINWSNPDLQLLYACSQLHQQNEPGGATASQSATQPATYSYLSPALMEEILQLGEACQLSDVVLPAASDWQQWHTNVITSSRRTVHVEDDLQGNWPPLVGQGWWANQWAWNCRWISQSLQELAKDLLNQQDQQQAACIKNVDKQSSEAAVVMLPCNVQPVQLRHYLQPAQSTLATMLPDLFRLTSISNTANNDNAQDGDTGETAQLPRFHPTHSKKGLLQPCHAYTFHGSVNAAASLGDVLKLRVNVDCEEHNTAATAPYLHKVEVICLSRQQPVMWTAHFCGLLPMSKPLELVPDPFCWSQWDILTDVITGRTVALHHNLNTGQCDWLAPPKPQLAAFSGGAPVPLPSKGVPRASSFTEGLLHSCTQQGTLIYLASALPVSVHTRKHHDLGVDGSLAIADQQVAVLANPCGHALVMHAKGGTSSWALQSGPAELGHWETTMEVVYAQYSIPDLLASQAECDHRGALRFESLVAVDDCAGELPAAVRFVVLADSTLAWSSPWMRSAGTTAHCRLDVTGVSVLSLCVESSFSAGGMAVWVDPHLKQLPLLHNTVAYNAPGTAERGKGATRVDVAEDLETGTVFLIRSPGQLQGIAEAETCWFRVAVHLLDARLPAGQRTLLLRLRGRRPGSLGALTTAWVQINLGAGGDTGRRRRVLQHLQLPLLKYVSEVQLQCLDGSPVDSLILLLLEVQPQHSQQPQLFPLNSLPSSQRHTPTLLTAAAAKQGTATLQPTISASAGGTVTSVRLPLPAKQLAQATSLLGNSTSVNLQDLPHTAAAARGRGSVTSPSMTQHIQLNSGLRAHSAYHPDRFGSTTASSCPVRSALPQMGQLRSTSMLQSSFVCAVPRSQSSPSNYLQSSLGQGSSRAAAASSASGQQAAGIAKPSSNQAVQLFAAPQPGTAFQVLVRLDAEGALKYKDGIPWLLQLELLSVDMASTQHRLTWVLPSGLWAGSHWVILTCKEPLPMPLASATLSTKNINFINAHVQCLEVVDLCTNTSTLLTPSASPSATPSTPTALFKPIPDPYLRISVATSDLPQAGTDSNVYLDLFGSDSAMLDLHLGLPASERFAHGSERTFICSALQLGTLQKLRVSHDNTGSSPNWHLDYVEVAHSASGRVQHFPCGAWLGKVKGERILEHMLTPINYQSSSRDHRSDLDQHYRTQNQDGAATDTSGSESGAGVGRVGSSAGWNRLGDGSSNRGYSADGSEAEYHLVMQLVGVEGHWWHAVQSIVIAGEDQNGVPVRALPQDLEQQDACCDMDADRRYVELLQVQEQDRMQPTTLLPASYIVEVHFQHPVRSSAMAPAQQDNGHPAASPQLLLMLHGALRSSGWLELDSSTCVDPTHELFSDGAALHAFKVTSEAPLARILRAEVQLPASSSLNGLHLERLVVQDALSGASEVFPAQRSLGLQPSCAAAQQLFTARSRSSLYLLPAKTTAVTFHARHIPELQAVNIRQDTPGSYPGWGISALDILCSYTSTATATPQAAPTTSTLSSQSSKLLPWLSTAAAATEVPMQASLTSSLSTMRSTRVLQLAGSAAAGSNAVLQTASSARITGHSLPRPINGVSGGLEQATSGLAGRLLSIFRGKQDQDLQDGMGLGALVESKMYQGLVKVAEEEVEQLQAGCTSEGLPYIRTFMTVYARATAKPVLDYCWPVPAVPHEPEHMPTTSSGLPRLQSEQPQSSAQDSTPAELLNYQQEYQAEYQAYQAGRSSIFEVLRLKLKAEPKAVATALSTIAGRRAFSSPPQQTAAWTFQPLEEIHITGAQVQQLVEAILPDGLAAKDRSMVAFVQAMILLGVPDGDLLPAMLPTCLKACHAAVKQAASIRRLFEAPGTCEFLDPNEAPTEAALQLLGLKVLGQTEELALAFTAMDLDGSKQLDLGEIAAAARKLVPGISDAALRLAVAYLQLHVDTCRDGQLSLPELQRGLASFIPPIPAAHLEAELDAMESGAVSIFQVLRAALKLHPAGINAAICRLNTQPATSQSLPSSLSSPGLPYSTPAAPATSPTKLQPTVPQKAAAPASTSAPSATSIRNTPPSSAPPTPSTGTTPPSNAPPTPSASTTAPQPSQITATQQPPASSSPAQPSTQSQTPQPTTLPLPQTTTPPLPQTPHTQQPSTTSIPYPSTPPPTTAPASAPSISGTIPASSQPPPSQPHPITQGTSSTSSSSKQTPPGLTTQHPPQHSPAQPPPLHTASSTPSPNPSEPPTSNVPTTTATAPHTPPSSPPTPPLPTNQPPHPTPPPTPLHLPMHLLPKLLTELFTQLTLHPALIPQVHSMLLLADSALNPTLQPTGPPTATASNPTSSLPPTPSNPPSSTAPSQVQHSLLPAPTPKPAACPGPSNTTNPPTRSTAAAASPSKPPASATSSKSATSTAAPVIQAVSKFVNCAWLSASLKLCNESWKRAAALCRMASQGLGLPGDLGEDVGDGGSAVENVVVRLAGMLLGDDSQAHEAVHQLDLDGSGLLEAGELLAAVKAVDPSVTAGQLLLLMAFLQQHADINRDGNITAVELLQSLQLFMDS